MSNEGQVQSRANQPVLLLRQVCKDYIIIINQYYVIKINYYYTI